MASVPNPPLSPVLNPSALSSHAVPAAAVSPGTQPVIVQALPVSTPMPVPVPVPMPVSLPMSLPVSLPGSAVGIPPTANACAVPIPLASIPTQAAPASAYSAYPNAPQPVYTVPALAVPSAETSGMVAGVLKEMGGLAVVSAEATPDPRAAGGQGTGLSMASGNTDAANRQSDSAVGWNRNALLLCVILSIAGVVLAVQARERPWKGVIATGTVQAPAFWLDAPSNYLLSQFEGENIGGMFLHKIGLDFELSYQFFGSLEVNRELAWGEVKEALSGFERRAVSNFSDAQAANLAGILLQSVSGLSAMTLWACRAQLTGDEHIIARISLVALMLAGGTGALIASIVAVVLVGQSIFSLESILLDIMFHVDMCYCTNGSSSTWNWTASTGPGEIFGIIALVCAACALSCAARSVCCNICCKGIKIRTGHVSTIRVHKIAHSRRHRRR